MPNAIPCAPAPEPITLTSIIRDIENQQQEIFLMLNAFEGRIMDNNSPVPVFEDSNDKCLMMRLNNLQAQSRLNMTTLRDILQTI